MPRLREFVPGVLVAQGSLYLTNSTVVVDGDRCLVVDPAVTPAEVAALAAEIGRRRLRVAAGFATHLHWDHVLWHTGLGPAPRYSRLLPADLPAEAELAARQAAEEAPGHDMELFGDLTRLPCPDRLPWEGPETRVIGHEGHCPGHAALFLPDTGTLLCGDMLSDVEIPLLDLERPDPVGDYHAGLDLLAGLPVEGLVCGHGTPVLSAARIRERVDADRRYLDALSRGRTPPDPRLARPWLAREHERALRALAARSG